MEQSTIELIKTTIIRYYLGYIEYGHSDVIPDNMKHYWNYAWETYFEYFTIIDSFKKFPYKIDNLLYDKATGIILINIEAGYHAVLMGAIEMLAQGMDERKVRALTDDIRDLSDGFIQNNRGFWMSDCEGTIWKASTFKLNAQEKMAFKDYTFKDIL